MGNPFRIEENAFDILRDITNKPPYVNTEDVVDGLSKHELDLLKKIGVTQSTLTQTIQDSVQVNYDRLSLYGQIQRALDHWMVGASMELYADYACLTASTKIPLLDGRTLTISEIVEENNQGGEHWVYSCDYKGKPKPAKLLGAIKQDHTPETLRIWLDNGKYVEASINHRFVRRDGTLCRADELVVGDSLMPFHRSYTKNGYERWWDIPKKNWSSTYKVVAEDVYGVNLSAMNRGKSVVEAKGNHTVVHHVDFNKSNNVPQNLKLMSAKDHLSLHSRAMVRRWKNSEWRRMMLKKNIESHNSPGYGGTEGNLKAWSRSDSEMRKEHLRQLMSNRTRSDEERKKISDSLKKNEAWKVSNKIAHDGPEYKEKMRRVNWDNVDVQVSRAEKCSAAQKERYASLSEEERQILSREFRTCAAPGCDVQFECISTSPKKYCCSGHVNKGNSKAADHLHVPSYNHKVVRIESIGNQVVYDISVSGSQLFGLDVGIYIHNTSWSSMHEASLWVTANSDKYENELNDMLDRIGMEEKIYDWAFNLGAYGDLFVHPEAGPGMGVIAVNDNEHPIAVSRADYKGQLIGFYWSPNTPNCGGIQTQGGNSGDLYKLMPPWEWVHFRLLGAKKKRFSAYENQKEIRSLNIVTGESTYQLTTRYGTSLLINALPTYKRLRLAEDSLLMARVTRGIIRYIWKLAVNQSSAEAVASLVDQYATMITRARAIDTDPDNPYYDSRQNPFSVMEDIFVPVWGNTEDLTHEKVGGEADIRWIVDIEQLRNQLAVSLRTPLSLLGGFVDEATGSLGSEAIEALDIRFARNARRLQRAVIDGVYRLCQINLAYMNMDPDPTLFTVHMGETSTAEEEAIRGSLDSGVDTIDKFLGVAENAVGEGELDKQKLFDYLSRKILRLEDFHIEDFVKTQDKLIGEAATRALAVEDAFKNKLLSRRLSRNHDLNSFVPVQWDTGVNPRWAVGDKLMEIKLSEGAEPTKIYEKGQQEWERLYGNAQLVDVEDKDE